MSFRQLIARLLRVLLAIIFVSCAGVPLPPPSPPPAPPLAEHARTNERFPIRDEALSPPIVEPIVRECAQAVHVHGFIPAALVQVWANGVEEVGIAAPHYGFEDIGLTRPLTLGEQITATQTVDGITSAHSHNAVSVEAWGPDLTRPEVVPEVWECGRVVDVANLTQSCRVKVFESGYLRGQAESPGDWKAVFTNTGLSANQPVMARQFACEDEPGKTLQSQPSTEVPVRSFPADFHAPAIEESTVVAGNDSVTLTDLYVGSHVRVFEDGAEAGSGYATGDTNWVPLVRPLTTSRAARIVADQELCKVSPKSAPVQIESQVPQPRILGPVCNDDILVRVGSAVVNATVVLLRNGSPIGMAGAKPGAETRLGLAAALQPGDVVSAVQFFGDTTTSPPSAGVKVCCCSDDCYDDLPRELDEMGWSTYPPATCPATAKPIFASAGPHDAFDFELEADWDRVNDPRLKEPNKNESVSEGTLRYVDPITNQTVSLPVLVRGRGHSRFDYCEYKPLKIEFAGQQTGNAFDGHKRLKLVTHCGNHPIDPWILGGTPTVQRRRLLAEYYFYRILQEQDSVGLSVRLGRMTYRNRDGSERLTEFVFWREDEDDACARCGWIEEAEDSHDIQLLTPNPTSLFQAHMINHFVYNNDYFPASGHNTIVCEAAGQEGFYIPYDWDLTGVVRPDYDKNSDANGNPIHYTENADDYASWLSAAAPSVQTKAQAWHFIQRDDEMRAILEGALLDRAGRELMLGWYDMYIRTLKCFLGGS